VENIGKNAKILRYGFFLASIGSLIFPFYNLCVYCTSPPGIVGKEGEIFIRGVPVMTIFFSLAFSALFSTIERGIKILSEH